MSDEPQNQISEENSIPPSPQEPILDAPISPIDSKSVEVPSGALESSPNDFSVKSNDIPPSDSTPPEPEKTQENEAENKPAPEPQPMTDQPSAEIQPPETALEPETPQISVNEPLDTVQDKPQEEPKQETSKSEPKLESPKKKIVEPEKEKPRTSYLKSQKWGELLVMARNAIQFRKRKKLNKIMDLFLKKSKITNDEVEKFLHVSDATATRYLSQLEKENKIKQVGKTGKYTHYEKI